MRPLISGVYHCHNPEVIKRLTRFCLGLSHLPYHKFTYSFKTPLTLWVIVSKVKYLHGTFPAGIYLFKVKNRSPRTSVKYAPI